MNELTIEDLSSQPSDLVCFPDFILSEMARRGIGSVEASYIGVVGERPASSVAWQHFSRTTRAGETIADVPLNHFRVVLARFAKFTGISPYAGQVCFAVRWPIFGALVPHRFSIFLCNEPMMAFWIRIYLYCIDGVYPTFENRTA